MCLRREGRRAEDRPLSGWAQFAFLSEAVGNDRPSCASSCSLDVQLSGAQSACWETAIASGSTASWVPFSWGTPILPGTFGGFLSPGSYGSRSWCPGSVGRCSAWKPAGQGANHTRVAIPRPLRGCLADERWCVCYREVFDQCPGRRRGHRILRTFRHLHPRGQGRCRSNKGLWAPLLPALLKAWPSLHQR